MGTIFAVSKCKNHTFSKLPTESIRLIEGEGVAGDAHRGITVKHRSRVRADPTQPNLRQVHLIHYELIQELRQKGFDVNPSTMGENITTLRVDLLSLPTGTILAIGAEAKIEITGLRNPCVQLDNYQKGLMAAVLDRDTNGNLVRKAGIMGIVLAGGEVKIGNQIKIILPPEPHQPLKRV